MDYNSLTAQIEAYANRFDEFFVEQVPNFIIQGVNRIYCEAKNIGFQTSITGNFTIGSTFLNKPLDWKETVSLSYINTADQFTYLLPRTFEFCTTYWPEVGLTSPPLFYADLSLLQQATGVSRWQISPTPDMAYGYLLNYLRLPLFNAANPTNFLTDRYPNLLLYACMVEAIPFLKDDERVPVFESLYNRALQSINLETTQRYTDRTSKRDKD